jgi:peptidoglycan/LPS O-acetylase OafA/YrhL
VSTQAHIAPLTGLGGIAAILVLATHYAVWTAPFDTKTRPDWIAYLLGDGVLGMTTFFALSGFVITYHYVSLRWVTAPWRSAYSFAILRLSRLYPALILFFFVTFDRSNFGWNALHFASLQSWVPAMLRGRLVEDSVYHVSWSISTEIGFYAAFALVMLVWSRVFLVSARLASIVVFAIVVAYIGVVLAVADRQPFVPMAAWWPGPFEPVDAHMWRRWFLNISPYARVIEFAVGAAAALVVRNCNAWLASHRPLLRGMAAVAATGLAALFVKHYWNADFLDWYVQLLGALAVGVILVNAEDESRLNTVLSSSFLMFVGRISYSLYLFHFLGPRFVMPVAARFMDIQGPFGPGAAALQVILFACSFAVAAALAWVSYRLIELPGQQAMRHYLLPSQSR